MLSLTAVSAQALISPIILVTGLDYIEKTVLTRPLSLLEKGAIEEFLAQLADEIGAPRERIYPVLPFLDTETIDDFRSHLLLTPLKRLTENILAKFHGMHVALAVRLLFHRHSFFV